jgi:inorganic triphosphatase YgiF
MTDTHVELPAAPQGSKGKTSAPAREVEIKFRAGESAISAVLASVALKGAKVGPAADLVSVYFDTPDRHMQRNGMTLRLRRKGRAIPVLGVKWDQPSAGDIFGRGEIEVSCPDGVPQFDLFDPAVADRLRAIVGGNALAPVFETRVKRRVVVLQHGRSQIELAIDEGAIGAGEARASLSEMEFELKSGSLTDLIDCASGFAREHGLSLAFEPKAARGFRLKDGAPPPPQKAEQIELPASTTFDDLVTAVLSNTLGHFVANWASLRESDAPESVHQLRVALRRMRSALGVFRRTVSLQEFESIRSEARRIASALGPARECDAFRQNALAGPLRDGPGQIKGAMQLLDAVELRRRQSYLASRALIDDSATSLFVLDVQALLARRGWRGALSASDLGLLTSEAAPYAAGVLDRLRRRAIKRGKTLPDMPDEERHELRIALKNLRYAAEFFGSLFENGKSQRAFLKTVSGLQEDLGAHNDAATARSFIDGLKLPPDSEPHFASGYLLGWYGHATTVADLHLVETWKTFKKADLFWE